MIRFNRLILVSNTENSHLGLGEYLRIASFLPNIKCNEIIWYCNQKLKKLLKEVDCLSKIISITSFNKKKFTNKDILINLTEQKIESQAKTLNILSYSKDKKSFKSKTKNLLSIIANELKIKKYRVFSNKKKTVDTNQIFINWKAPDEWKIKMYPQSNWRFIINKLQKSSDVKIKFQKKNSDLDTLIKEIKKSKIVVSIVSLACHIAILYNKKLIMLSGPNNFDDIKLYKKATVITPDNLCNYRPCNLPKGIFNRNCGCMGFINKNDVYQKILDEL